MKKPNDLNLEGVNSTESVLGMVDQSGPGPEYFLEAWKEGVEIAGQNFFIVKSGSVEGADDRDDLRPNLEVVESSIGVLSPGERVFILSMYQFFCASDVVRMCSETGIEFPTLTDVSYMDSKRRKVITRLIESYSGW